MKYYAVASSYKVTLPQKHWWSDTVWYNCINTKIVQSETKEVAEALSVSRGISHWREKYPESKVELVLVDAVEIEQLNKTK